MLWEDLSPLEGTVGTVLGWGSESIATVGRTQNGSGTRDHRRTTPICGRETQRVYLTVGEEGWARRVCVYIRGSVRIHWIAGDSGTWYRASITRRIYTYSMINAPSCERRGRLNWWWRRRRSKRRHDSNPTLLGTGGEIHTYHRHTLLYTPILLRGTGGRYERLDLIEHWLQISFFYGLKSLEQAGKVRGGTLHYLMDT